MCNLNKNFKNFMVEATVKCMLNPDNHELYLGNLTLDTLADLIDNNSDRAEVIFKAFAIAQAQYFELEAYDLILEEAYYEAIEPEINYIQNLRFTCPNCKCKDYTPGCKCPNCDYEEN